MKWLILLIGIFSNSLASLLVKIGMQSSHSINSLKNPLTIFQNLPLISGVFLYVITFIVYILALKIFPLNIAHPILTSGAIAMVAIFSVYFLDESFKPNMLLGLFFIVFGVTLLTNNSN